MTEPRLALGAGAIAAVAAANVVAVLASPRHLVGICLIGGGIAVALAIRAALAEPAQVIGAAYATLPGVAVMVAAGRGPWLLGAVGALLLVAAELGTWHAEHRGPEPDPALTRRRVTRSLRIAGAGLAVGVLLTVVTLVPLPQGSLGVLLAALAVAGVAALLSTRRT